MNNNFLKIKKDLKFYLFSFNEVYVIFIFSNKRFYLSKIEKKMIRLILYFNYLYFFSYLKSIIKFFYLFFMNLMSSFNYIFKRVLEARGRGYKYFLKFKNRLYLFSEVRHLFYFDINFLNYNLLKYNIVEILCRNFFLLTFFINVLSNLKKKDKYKGKGFYEITKKVILKLGKKSEYLR